MVLHLAFVALFVLATATCAEQAPAADASKGEIAVELREHTISMSAHQIRAGTVTFIVRNRGTIAHDFIVIKTDLAPDKLAVDQNAQKVSEEGRVGGVMEIPPAKNGNLRLDLGPGHYVIVCNVPTHYQLGMRTELTVQ